MYTCCISLQAAPTPAQSTTGTPPPPSSSSSHSLPLSLSTLSTGSHLSTTTTKALLELFNALAKASPSSDNSKVRQERSEESLFCEINN